jgi:hypothetical protein
MIGRPQAFVELFIFLVVFGIVIAFASRRVDTGIAVAGCAFVIIGSLVSIWKARQARKNPKYQKYGYISSQVGILPKKWRNWVLGEDEDSEKQE